MGLKLNKVGNHYNLFFRVHPVQRWCQSINLCKFYVVLCVAELFLRCYVLFLGCALIILLFRLARPWWGQVITLVRPSWGQLIICVSVYCYFFFQFIIFFYYLFWWGQVIRLVKTWWGKVTRLVRPLVILCFTVYYQFICFTFYYSFGEGKWSDFVKPRWGELIINFTIYYEFVCLSFYY